MEASELTHLFPEILNELEGGRRRPNWAERMNEPNRDTS